MNPLYIALPLFCVFVWVIVIIAARHDKKVRDRHELEVARDVGRSHTPEFAVLKALFIRHGLLHKKIIRRRRAH